METASSAGIIGVLGVWSTDVFAQVAGGALGVVGDSNHIGNGLLAETESFIMTLNYNNTNMYSGWSMLWSLLESTRA